MCLEPPLVVLLHHRSNALLSFLTVSKLKLSLRFELLKSKIKSVNIKRETGQQYVMCSLINKNPFKKEKR